MILARILLPLQFSILVFAADYQLCFLNDGPNAGKLEPERAKQLQAAHMQHIGDMWKSGALESAGPISGLPGSRGIFLFQASTAEAARLASLDPKVIAGDLKVDCQTWKGPEGVGKSYRKAYGKPGFKEIYVRRVGLLMKKVTPGDSLGGVLVAGPMTGGDYGYFALLETDDLEKVKKQFPDARTFLWFHDAQVWDGVS